MHTNLLYCFVPRMCLPVCILIMSSGILIIFLRFQTELLNFPAVLFSHNFLCTTTFEPFRGGVRRTQMRSRFLVCLNGHPQEVAMSRRDQTRFVFIRTPLCCVAHKHVVQRRHVSFERPLRQTQNHSDAVCVSANSRLWNCPNFGGHKS